MFWAEMLNARARLRISLDVLRQWDKATDEQLEWAVGFTLGWRDGWLERHPEILHPKVDDVFHARGFIIDKGWKPPREIWYKGKTLHLDENVIQSLMDVDS